VDYIRLEETGYGVYVVGFNPHVVIAEQINLRPGDTPGFEVVLDLFQIIQVVTHIVEALHEPSLKFLLSVGPPLRP
jgi:hypothetical protein